MKQRLLFLTLFTFLFTSQAFYSQNKNITGIVTFSNKMNAQGVTIVLKGSAISTQTDALGKYTLTVPKASTTLFFSYVGMTTVEEKINDR